MSEPIVSSYETAFVEAFGRGISAMPDDHTKVIKDIVDKIHERVISDIENYIMDDMKSNINDSIRQEAASVASSMLADALAGDDKEIRSLFGFHEWYMKSPWRNDGKPTQWALIDAIVARRPDLFVDERIKQRDREIEVAKGEIARLNKYIERQRDEANRCSP